MPIEDSKSPGNLKNIQSLGDINEGMNNLTVFLLFGLYLFQTCKLFYQNHTEPD